MNTNFLTLSEYKYLIQKSHWGDKPVGLVKQRIFEMGFIDAKLSRNTALSDILEHCDPWRLGKAAWEDYKRITRIAYLNDQICFIKRFFEDNFYAEIGAINHAVICGWIDVTSDTLARSSRVERTVKAREYLSSYLRQCYQELALLEKQSS